MVWEQSYRSLRRQRDFEWAWEFLRRNEEYREEWRSLVLGSPEPLNPQDGDMSPDDPEFYYEHEEATKWGLLHGYLNPDQAEPAWLGFKMTFGNIFMVQIPSASAPGLPAAGTAGRWVDFDLRMDLKPQLVQIGRALRKKQRELRLRGLPTHASPKPQRHLWRFYLFLIDITKEGATARQIADAFPKDPATPGITLTVKVVRERLAKAQALKQPAGYLPLLRLDS